MLEEVREARYREQVAKATANFASARGRLIFWWLVVAIDGLAVLFLRHVHFQRRWILAVESGMTLLAVVGVLLALLATSRMRKAKVMLDGSHAVREEFVEAPRKQGR